MKSSYCFVIIRHLLIFTVEPELINESFPYVFREDHTNIAIDVRMTRQPYPESIIGFFWTLNGVVQSNDSRRIFGYPRVTFRSLRREDAGNYTLTAINQNNIVTNVPIITSSILNLGQNFGFGTGGFTLDVLCKYYLLDFF